MLERGVQGLLKSFFAQPMIGDPPNGVTSQVWQRLVQTPGGSIRAGIPLDENESSVMEVVMTELRMRDTSGYYLLQRYWGCGESDGFIARQYVPARSKGMSKEDVTAWRVRLEAQIEARLGTV